MLRLGVGTGALPSRLTMEPFGARGRSGRDGPTADDHTRDGALPAAAVPRRHLRVRGHPEAQRSRLPRPGCSVLHRHPARGLLRRGARAAPPRARAVACRRGRGGVALLEIMIGAVVLMGVLTRPAAAIGLALNLVLFLTATWHTTPYFLGSDIVFVFAWLPFVLAGAEGQPTIRALLARRQLGLRRMGAPGRVLSRRALLAQALGLAGLVTAAAATASTLARGSYQAPP